MHPNLGPINYGKLKKQQQKMWSISIFTIISEVNTTQAESY